MLLTLRARGEVRAGGPVVSVINTLDNTVIETISNDLGDRYGTDHIVFDSKNNRMYITTVGSENGEAVLVINTLNNKVIKILSDTTNPLSEEVSSSCCEQNMPRGIAFDSNNNSIYVTNSDTSGLLLQAGAPVRVIDYQAWNVFGIFRRTGFDS